MPLSINRFVGGPIETNTYLLADTTTGDAIVIDASGGVTDEIVETATSLGATINQIIVTHGHWDHIQDLKSLHDALAAPIAGHPMVRNRVESPAAGSTPVPIEPAILDEEISEGDTVTVGGHAFRVMDMPGHDEAHIILYSEQDRLVFGGDVLFPGGHGRTDIPGSDQDIMNRTLGRFLDMPDDVRVFPGHGDATTVSEERPWINQIPEDNR